MRDCECFPSRISLFFLLPCIQAATADSIKCEEFFFDWLRNCHLLRKDSSTCSYLNVNPALGTSRPPLKWVTGTSRGQNGRIMELTTHLHLVHWLRVSGEILTFSHKPSWCVQGHLYFTCIIIIIIIIII